MNGYTSKVLLAALSVTNMARLGVDVSEVKSPFTPLPEGNYRFKVIGQEVGKSQAQEAMLSLQYEVIGGEHAGRKAFNFAMLEGKGEQSGKYLIHQHSLIAGDNPQDPDPETWLNSEFDAEVTVEISKKNGKAQNRIEPLFDVGAHYQVAGGTGVNA